MNSKNIAKSLNAKVNEWLQSIDDESIVKAVKDNIIVSGGAIVSMLNNEKVNDYDIYFRTQSAVEKIARYYLSQFAKTNPAKYNDAFVKVDEHGRVSVFIASDGETTEDIESFTDETEIPQENSLKKEKPKYRPIFLSSNAITLSDKIQIIIRFYGEPEEIHENYDFIHCTCYWTSWDNKAILPSRALEAIINKELYYMGSKYPLCSIIRTRKFLSRGYTINAGQYLKMALQLNQLNLLDIDTLTDQVIGIDSLYFNQAINAIKERLDREPDWKLDSNYIIEIINRIF